MVKLSRNQMKSNKTARWGSLLVGLCFAVLAWSAIKIVDVSTQWKMVRVHATNLLLVDNIVIDDKGVIYATLEIKYIGQLVKILPDGKVEVLLKNLNRADGLLLHRGKLYITEEVKQGRVLEYDLKTKTLKTLFKLNLPEGIDVYRNGDLVVSEDVENGGIYKWTTKGKLELIIKTMHRPEGMCIDKQQALYIAETSKNRVVRYYKDRIKTVIDNIREPDQIECHPDGSLWITEDKKDGRLLRFHKGKLEVIATNLKSPQGIAFGKNGEVYVAEQRMARIIVFRRQ